MCKSSCKTAKWGLRIIPSWKVKWWQVEVLEKALNKIQSSKVLILVKVHPFLTIMTSAKIQVHSEKFHFNIQTPKSSQALASKFLKKKLYKIQQSKLKDHHRENEALMKMRLMKNSVMFTRNMKDSESRGWNQRNKLKENSS